MRTQKSSRDLYSFPGFHARANLRPHPGDSGGYIVTLERRQKKRSGCGKRLSGLMSKPRPCGDNRRHLDRSEGRPGGQYQGSLTAESPDTEDARRRGRLRYSSVFFVIFEKCGEESRRAARCRKNCRGRRPHLSLGPGL